MSVTSHSPLLFSSRAHPFAEPALLPHVDDAVCLSKACQNASFVEITNLLYLNWNILHFVDALMDINKWLENLSKEDHLLLVHLHAAYWVTIPDTALSFGQTKTNFWNAVNSASRFLNGVFVVTHEIPLVSVTVESFMVQKISGFNSYRFIWNISIDDVLGSSPVRCVHPQYD